mmetsp:Transcript_71770/g.165991  ORF Transcript_71770/g.165991 Transcript_71770/m.165991 type:complete len:216 (-) Transcript_71770:8-655(-)
MHAALCAHAQSQRQRETTEIRAGVDDDVAGTAERLQSVGLAHMEGPLLAHAAADVHVIGGGCHEQPRCWRASICRTLHGRAALYGNGLIEPATWHCCLAACVDCPSTELRAALEQLPTAQRDRETAWAEAPDNDGVVHARNELRILLFKDSSAQHFDTFMETRLRSVTIGTLCRGELETTQEGFAGLVCFGAMPKQGRECCDKESVELHPRGDDA